MTQAKGMGINIKAVAERTGVPLHTLRAWERRYGIPRPNRNTENHYRLYDEQDIADVLWMKRQVQAGVSPAQASALLLAQTREGLRVSDGAAQPSREMQAALFQAFQDHDDAAAQHILNEAWSAFSTEQVVREILQPTLHQIGKAWQRNTLSVEQEHFASNLVRQRLHALIQAQPPAPLLAPRLVAACAPEEQHDLGLLIFTLLARRQGWHVTYLGQRTPLADLEHAGRGARFIVLTVSTVTGLASLVPLWNKPLTAAPILFGGDVFNLHPHLREHIPGAFLGADGVEGIQTLTTLSPRVSAWKPSRRLLNSALALEAARLPIVSETVRQFLEHAPKLTAGARNAFRQDMTHATMFLTDAVVSALAFDVPEVMDAEGAWLDEFMPAHHVSMDAVRQFVTLYNATAAQHLSTDAAKAVNSLVTRLVTATAPQREEQP